MKPTERGRSTAERAATDERLRSERRRTDDELARTRAARDEDVGRMLDESCARMDHVAHSADARDVSASPDVLAREHRGVAEGREATVGVEERARLDVRLATKRAALERDIGTLLSRERGETDERLLQERTRADAEIGSRDDFLAMVSHDLRGMLNGIAMSGALLSHVDVDDRERETLDREARRIARIAGRMNRLIGDLLDVSRLDAGKLEIILALDDPTNLLQEAVDSARPLAQARGITLSWHGPG